MRALSTIIVKENPGNGSRRAGVNSSVGTESSQYAQFNGRGRSAQVS
jgi:hypothetical protein